ncbi:MAG: WYL domain-containing protein [Lachnospiraceae bacterium]|nr:WYL domain-containing protein [Lachnospiraceae bacterium]
MAKGTNQKSKLLYLAKIFSEQTDDEHKLTMPEIISRLQAYDINADRKTLYQDFEELRVFGLDIIMEKDGRNTYYFLGSRMFELPELKLLVDSVQSAKFITNKKSAELIKKLESLTSVHQAKQLQRQVFISGRNKVANENIYYNVDQLHEAINSNAQICFHYYQWNVQKERELRKNGAWYQVSPWGLIWDNENYYLIGYDAQADKIKHYRVDKMLDISISSEKREGNAQFQAFNLPLYSKVLFGMYGGAETRVTLEAKNSMANILIDRFGTDITLHPIDAEHFRVSVEVAVSNQFFGWIIALGDGIQITGPQSVVDQMSQLTQQLAKRYPSVR